MSKKVVESYRRKLAAEEGWTQKRGAQLRVALCYPNVYTVGMANLGFQAVYELFNRVPEVSCERVFLPDDAEAREHERTATRRLSFEAQARGGGARVRAHRVAASFVGVAAARPRLRHRRLLPLVRDSLPQHGADVEVSD